MIGKILEDGYIEPQRPYSQNELLSMRHNLFNKMHIGTTRASHNKCGHFYYVKKNGRKEKEIKDSGKEDCGNCSVCWKFNKTPNRLRNIVVGIIADYTSIMYNEPTYLTYETTNVILIFTQWLYE